MCAVLWQVRSLCDQEKKKMRTNDSLARTFAKVCISFELINTLAMNHCAVCYISHMFEDEIDALITSNPTLLMAVK